jgi:methylase of polypeptide subunit release factors
VVEGPIECNSLANAPIVLPKINSTIATNGNTPSSRGRAISSTSARPDSQPSWSVYTPAHIVAYMLRTSLAPEFESQPLRRREALRILDPACGDGAFLCGALDFLREQYARESPNERPSDGGEIARRHLFGVDIHRPALEAFRRNLRERGIAPQAISGLFRSNVLCGDALCGPDFSDRSTWNSGPEESIDWPRFFPEAVEAGGFDLVIGNPPYLRERDAKPLFDHLAQSPLGQRWRQARMDLWYYFLHRAIDLTRPGGTVCFIVNSYWVGSQGARKLIDRLERETTPLEFTRIEAAPIFPGVAGRHLIVRLRKGRQSRRCRVIDLSHVGRSASEPSFWHRLAESGPDPMQDVGVRAHWADRETLFQHGRISLAPPMETALAGCVPLDSQFEVRQGIAENPPSITAAHVREFGDRYHVGQGVFVLDPSELAALQLSPEELACVRPYDETALLGRYRLPGEASHALLYLTKNTAPTLERLPRIAAHLERFRPLLERRREVQ